MSRLQGKSAIITGAAGGQGAAVARRFVAEGARVLLADIADDEGKRLADGLGEAALYHHLDVSSEDGWREVVESATEAFGSLNVLINNAGVLHFSSLVETNFADYERVVRINQFGTFLGMRAVVPAMTAAGGGSIINVSSVEGLAGMPFLVAYTSTKFAIRGMTKVAAMELGKQKIRVNSVHPGMINTEMIRGKAGEQDLSSIEIPVPLGRIGQPEEVAEVEVFLASDESSYCTGAEFVADGGATATHSLGGTL
jgi:3alpha(or 20beta)-hydroxysteroid dehydrogenase